MTQNHVLEQVRCIVDELVATSDPDYETAVIMVAALFIGPNVDAIVDLTGCTRDIVDSIASRMRASGMWTDEGVDYDDWFSDDLRGIVAFAMNLHIATGKFIRTNQKTSTGDWIYEAVDHKVCQS
jgi:hypothetical protein